MLWWRGLSTFCAIALLVSSAPVTSSANWPEESDRSRDLSGPADGGDPRSGGAAAGIRRGQRSLAALCDSNVLHAYRRGVGAGSETLGARTARAGVRRLARDRSGAQVRGHRAGRPSSAALVARCVRIGGDYRLRL